MEYFILLTRNSHTKTQLYIDHLYYILGIQIYFF